MMKIKVVLPNVKGKSSIFKLASQRLHNLFAKNTQIDVQFICSKVHTSPCFTSMTFVDFTHPFIVSHLDASNVSSFSLWLKIY